MKEYVEERLKNLKAVKRYNLNYAVEIKGVFGLYSQEILKLKMWQQQRQASSRD